MKKTRFIVPESSPVQFCIRIFCYVLGLFLLALGSAFSINSNMGVSPVNALPCVISAVCGASVSTCLIVVFSCYVLLQAVILGKAFKPINLLQVAFSVMFGYFVDFAQWILGDFGFANYPGQLLMLIISIPLVSLGVFLTIEVDLIPMASEGLVAAFAQKWNMPFPKVKGIIDCICVVVSVAVSLLCLHKLVAIREGTVIMALVTGKVLAFLKSICTPHMQRICFKTSDYIVLF